MRIIKVLVALPMILLFGILRLFATAISWLYCRLMFLIAVAGRMIGIGTGAETLQMMTVAFVVFIIPYIAEWLIIRIAAINYGLRDFIKS